MAKFVKRLLMFCVVCMGAATVESQTGNCSDCSVSMKFDHPKLLVLDNGTNTTYNCTRPCSDEAHWCLKDTIKLQDLLLDRNRHNYVISWDGTSEGTHGMEGNCTLKITILTVEMLDGGSLFCSPDCDYYQCSLETPYVLHVKVPLSPSPTRPTLSPSPTHPTVTLPHPTDNTPGTITITTTVTSSIPISSQGPPSPSPTCPHPTDNTPGTITITTTVTSSIPISSQEPTLTTKSSTLVVPSPSQTCITEFGKVVTCGANRALPGVVVIVIGFLAAIIVRLL